MQVAFNGAVVNKLFTAKVPGLFQFVSIQVGKLVILEFRHGFGQNLLVGFIAQVGNEPTLLRSEQIACTADVKILHGNVYTRPQVREVLDSFKSAARLIGQHGKRWSNEVAKSLARPSSHTSAHLVQVR